MKTNKETLALLKTLNDEMQERIKALNEIIFYKKTLHRLQVRDPKMYAECFDLGEYLLRVGKV